MRKDKCDNCRFNTNFFVCHAECGGCDGKSHYKPRLRKAIAIDFDGCLFENKYPDIGDPIWDTINAAKREQEAGAGLILWTCREGALLADAIAAAKNVGLTFDEINDSLPEWREMYGNSPKKVGASEYWDDRAVRMPRPAVNDTKGLLELISKRRDLPIVPMVDGEIVCGDEYARWLGEFGSSYIGKYIIGEERVHFYEETMFMEDIETVLTDLYDYDYFEDLTEEQAIAEYKLLPWKEAIIVNIDVPA